ncbi:hypothetical protein IV203_003579 [Nitzschia inconspicua]|uniref:Uncharacterized protein n=1 Tax=Nitzschia inconspicua TaxID=303405 RepID=A0A9K3PNV2_9STRA|nr:hypothetical protein IV203_003579 [Nitzschia inconspicua]
MTRLLLIALVYTTALMVTTFVEGFIGSSRSSLSMPQTRQVASTELFFGLPSFGPKDDEKEEDPSLEKNKIGLAGLVQLITAGAGAPFLGDFQGVDKETGKFMFSLEANNLVDENGESKQTKMPYFESGWVDPEDLAKEQQRKENGFKFPWQK